MHVPNITALHHAQFGECGSPSTMVTIGGAESSPPLPPRGKEDILKAVGIRVKRGTYDLSSSYIFLEVIHTNKMNQCVNIKFYQ